MNAQVKEQWPVGAESYPVLTVPKVYGAIVKVMKDIGKAGISKDRENKQQGYSFRGIDDVYNALNGFISEANLCVLPRVMKRDVTERVSQKGGALFYVVLDVEFDFVSAEDGSKHTVSTVGEAMDSGDKATNKAMSAAYKYACMEVFCIPTEGDNDADRTTHEVAAAPVPEDCWTALNDAAKLGEKELRRVWKDQISESTRELITGAHGAKWDTIKAIATGIDNQKKATS
jgi:hypothetical protein